MRKLFLFPLLLFISFFCAAEQPQLECEKKWGEVKFRGRPVRRYRLRANHFPEGKRFFLTLKWFNGEEFDTFSYIANHKGHLILEADDIGADPLYALCPLKKGERIEFVMKAEEDPTFCTTTSIVPFPNTFKTKSGVSLSLEIKGQNGDAFQLKGDGFNSGEVIELLSTFQGSEQRYTLIASSQGMVDFPIELQVKDRKGGDGILLLSRSDEEITFYFQGGKAALEYAGGFALQIR